MAGKFGDEEARFPSMARSTTKARGKCPEDEIATFITLNRSTRNSQKAACDVKLTSFFSATWGAYHLTKKSGWSVKSIMVRDLPIYRRNATSVTV